MVAFDRWALSALIGLSVLACTVDLDGQCNDNADCPNGQICTLGGCIIGAEAPPDSGPMDAQTDGPPPDMRLDAMVEPPADRGPDAALDMLLDAAPDMPLDAGFDLGPDMAPPAVTLLSPPIDVPIVVTQRRGIGRQLVNFSFSAPIQDPELLLTLTESNCEVDAQSSLDIDSSGNPRSGMANLTNATAVNWDCVARFSSRVVFFVGGVRRELPGPPIIIDHQPPEYLSDNLQVWPTPDGGYQILLRAGEDDSVQLFSGRCDNPQAPPQGDRINPRAEPSAWQVYPFNADGPLFHAVVLSDALGNARCVDRAHSRPPINEERSSFCSQGVTARQPLTTRGAASVHPVDNCLNDRMLLTQEGHQRVLEGRCDRHWPMGHCTEFVRFERGGEVAYAQVDLRFTRQPRPGFRGPFSIALNYADQQVGEGAPDELGMRPVSHALAGNQLFVGGAGGLIARSTLTGGVPGPAIIQGINTDGPAHLAVVRTADGPQLYVGNMPQAGQVSRCTSDLVCMRVGPPGIGDTQVNGVVAADVDGDGEQELVTCQSDGSMIYDGDQVRPGPPQALPGDAPSCVEIAAGRLRPGTADTIVTVVDQAGAITMRAFWLEGDNWQTFEFDEDVTAKAPFIGDRDQNGLDELYAVVDQDQARAQRLHQIRFEDGGLVIGAQQLVNGLNVNVQSYAISDVDRDGRPDAVGVSQEGAAGDNPGRLFYQFGLIGSLQSRRPPVPAISVHPLSDARDELLLYQHGQVTVLRPAQPATRWPLPDRPQADTPGVLLAGGFDLDGDQIAEAAWGEREPDGSTTLRVAQMNGDGWRLRPTPIPALHDLKVLPADLDRDGVVELAVVGVNRDGNDRMVEVYQINPTEDGPVTSRIANFALQDGRLLDVQATDGLPYLLTQQGDAAPILYSQDSPAFATEQFAIARWPDLGLAAAGCSSEDDNALALNTLPPGSVVQPSVELNGPCLRVAAVNTGGDTDPRLIVAYLNGDSQLSILTLGDGDAVMGEPFDLGTPGVSQIHLADITGDLLDDVVLTYPGELESPSGLRLLTVNAAGVISPLTDNQRPDVPGDASQVATFAVATGDFNGDGLPDVLVQSSRPGANGPILNTWLMAGATQ